MVIILAYVDDYLVATNDKSWYENFFAAFHSQYACKNLGILDLVMGIGVRWGDGTAYVSQRAYISQRISTYGLTDAKPAALPMSPGTALSPSDGKDATLLYRALLGQLQWVARCSRPGIMAAVSVLSRFCATYGPDHFVALKQVVSLVIFSSMIQKCVSLSTTEAEIIAMSEGAREVKYILNVPDSLVSIGRPVPIYCDNQGAIHLATDYVNNSRSKHIQVRNMYIRELIKAKDTGIANEELAYARSRLSGYSERLSGEMRVQTGGACSVALMLSHWQRLEEDPYFVPTTEEEKEEFGEQGEVCPANMSRKYIDSTRTRKGLPVEKKLVVSTKQRTRAKKK
ncbi:hypothetical protein CYMTET_17776 [Cymbomonas tetramitiformis]|uniref:Reverse transcriptase Ty1/copia-type domain-containing protein n=1 Tax=Cymbomonas tetramitiformis TaxID=36881 RepID=A0AAE0G9K8_9CHLO|nr:hypothetical protein CYMTET_17776 [Cymbomonas tetramitiformis]